MRKNNNWSNSSFWLDEDFTSSGNSIFDDLGSSKPKGRDLLKLAGYRRAIANFVNIVTAQNIPVQFSGNDSYTNGKMVNISAKLNDNEFDPAVGLALHEGSHIKLTDFDVLTSLEGWVRDHEIYIMDLAKKHGASVATLPDIPDKYWALGYVLPKLKDLINIIEDRRIDNFIYKTAPGYRGYYESLYNKYFNSKIVDKGLISDEYTEANWESYMFRICNITNKNTRLDVLDLDQIWNMIDLKDIARLKNTFEVRDLAFEVFKFIEEQIPSLELDKDKEEEEEEDGDGKDDGGSGDCEGEKGEPISGDEEGDGKDDGSKADGDEAEKGSGTKDKPLSSKQLGQLDKAIKKQNEFLNGDVKKKKLSKSDLKSLNAMEESGIEMKEVEFELQSEYTDNVYDKKQNVYIIKNVTQNLIDSNQFPEMFSAHNGAKFNNSDSIKEGLILGKMLGKKLKIRAEEKDLKFNRLRSGKIDSRMIASCGYGNESIFEKIECFSYNPGILHISIDNSGSMSGGRLRQAMKTTAAIAKACSMIDNMEVVVSARSADNVGHSREYIPVIAIIYDSRKDHLSKLINIMPQVNACGTTPEGLCFSALMDEIVNASRGKDSYFINMCDGMPYFNGYRGESAMRHTKLQVGKMRKEGIKILSYFIGSDRGGSDWEKSNFQKMYGKDSEFVNTNNLISLARTMNDKFLETV
jgi:hypothetical protein